MAEHKWKSALYAGIFIVLAIVAMVGIPLLTGTGSGGFESSEVLNKFFFYVGPGIGFLLGSIVLFILEFIIKDKDVEYGSSVLIHSPDEPPAITSFWKNSYKLGVFHYIVLFMIIFSIASIFAMLTQTFYTGVPTEQQFTKTADLSAGTEPASTSETLGDLFFMGLGLVGLRYFARKSNMPKSAFWVLAIIVIVLISTVYGVINHELRYGSSETSMFVVLRFWAFMGLLTALSGSILPAWILHIANNFYFKLSKIYGSDAVTITAVIVVFLSIILYILILYFLIKNLKKKNAEIKLIGDKLQ